MGRPGCWTLERPNWFLLPPRGRPKLTREGYQSFTPQYASPEQVLGNPITTASDTYSLGVLLTCATGTAPYELKEMTTAEMLRVICEEPPRRPTHTVDSQRLDADLEAILLKALRKEPRERYLTADQLASDLRAYLDGQPVGARRGTFRYRAGKFMRRHRWGLAAAALLAATLIWVFPAFCGRREWPISSGAGLRHATGGSAPIERQPAFRVGRSHQATPGSTGVRSSW